MSTIEDQVVTMEDQAALMEDVTMEDQAGLMEDVTVEDQPIEEENTNDEPYAIDEEKTERSHKGRDVNRFPHTRIRTIMKMEPDLTIASQESVYLITKAAELFVQLQAKEAYKRTKLSKRKTVQKRDLDSAISEIDCMAFLEGAID